MYDGLLPLVAAGLGTDAVGWLSFPQKIDDEDCGEELECWKIPPHAGVEWPEELECVCCGCGWGWGLGSFWNKIEKILTKKIFLIFTWDCCCCCRWISWSDVLGKLLAAFHGADCWFVADRDFG